MTSLLVCVEKGPLLINGTAMSPRWPSAAAGRIAAPNRPIDRLLLHAYDGCEDTPKL
jgi:hypothetical protein